MGAGNCDAFLTTIRSPVNAIYVKVVVKAKLQIRLT